MRLLSLRLRQYAKNAEIGASGFLADGPLFLMDFLLRLARVVVLLALWRILFAGRGDVSGMTLASVLTYTLISEAFAEQLRARTQLEVAFWEGSIVTRYLQPVGLVGGFVSEMVGRWIVSFALFSLPLLLIAPLLGVSPRPASGGAAGAFVVSLTLAVVVGVAVQFVFGAIVVYLGENVWLVEYIRGALETVFSGALVPLALLPWGLGSLFDVLPFASMASAPLRIYTGTGDPALLIAVQAGWAVVLWPFALWLWRANRERVVGYGG